MAEHDSIERSERSALLDAAHDNGEFRLHYQPKLDLSDGRVVGAEALLRWQRPGHGLVSAGAFLADLSATTSAAGIGEWVLRTACAQARAWHDAGLSPLTVSVNISAEHFRDDALVERVRDALDASGCDPAWLAIELTEETVMHDPDQCAAKLTALRALGVRLALDDFGTGYSSLSYLRRFPLDQLKIDKSFIREVTANPDDAAIVRAVISMGHSLGLTIIAEGVETEAQLQWLRRERCDEIQGYLWSPAVTSHEFEQMLRSGRRLYAEGALGNGSVGEPRTVLVVDDEVNIVQSLVRLLRREGYRILTAANAAEAFDLLAKNTVQVIISDHRMPLMTGAEFLGRVKSIYPQTVRILFSGYIEMDALVEAVNRGAVFRLVLKPWDEADLRKMVRDAFEHHWLSTRTPALPDAGIVAPSRSEPG